jgi:hypothetical protein
MTPDGKSLIMESDKIIHQSQGSEANKLYKINGLYYHYFSEVNKEGRVIWNEPKPFGTLGSEATQPCKQKTR